MKANNKELIFNSLEDATIALVYIFEKEEAPGFGHYDIWKSDVIAEWMLAVQELHCMPYIIDVRSFISKAMDHSLPELDYVVNLNAGAKEVSALGLVPIIASFLGVPCIPCDTLANLAAEHKKMANLIAKAIGLKMSENLDHSVVGGVYRPLNYGSSKGMRRQWPDDSEVDGVYQKFVPGYDITTPILYNPLTEKIDLLPTVMYCPPDLDPNWMFDAQVKARRGGYTKKILYVDEETQKKYLQMAEATGIYAFCRIDARIKCVSSSEWSHLFEAPVSYEKIYFLEINATPTIKPRINFLDAIDNLKEGDALFEAYEVYRKTIENATHTGFLLACSMLAASKARHYEKMD